MAKYYKSSNEYDGFDGKDSAQPYDDKKEKRFQADIWILLAVIFFLILVKTCYEHMSELYLVNNGSCIEAEYHSSSMRATYFDENNAYYGFDISVLYPRL